MEAEERPSKLRKLSHDHSDDVDIIVDAPGLSQPQSEPAQNAEAVHTIEARAGAEGAESRTAARKLEGTLNAQMDRTSDAEGQPAEPVLSKNQLKKLKRKAEWEAGREDRKLKRKEKTKEKKARKRAERDEEAHQPEDVKEAGLQGDDIPINQPRAGLPRRQRRQRLPIAFVIDCGFDGLMAEKERTSLGSQLTRVYSDNSKAPFQAHLYVSSWTKESELRKRFEGLLKGMYKNWKGMVFTEHDFAAASEMAEREMRGKYGGKMVGAFERYAPAKEPETNSANNGGHLEQRRTINGDDESVDLDPVKLDSEAAGIDIANDTAKDPQIGSASEAAASSIHGLQEAGEVIYLTSDSPYTLTELKPYHTYIIGGLVDKNRHKGICYKTALNKNDTLAASTTDDPSTSSTNSSTASILRRKGIKTAKLPIGEYMSMTARHVLATSHVVEIMLRWLETRDWGQAFLSVMPKRKGGVLRTIKAEDDNEPVGDGGATLEDDDGDQSDHTARQEAADAATLQDGSESEAEAET